MPPSPSPGLVALDLVEPIWERIFIVAPLVVVGTHEEDGSVDLAPKHMAGALSWENHFGFVCTRAHSTYRNVERTGAFAVSFPRPEQVVHTSLAAAPRCGDGSKPGLAPLATSPGTALDVPLLDGAYLQLECELDRIVEDLGPNGLVVGRIVAARAAEDALRDVDRDDGDLLAGAPVFAYLHPGRYAAVAETFSFPFHEGFSR